MKKIINNVNKLALVALALFVTVGVVSCGCKDDDKGKTDVVKVKLSIDKDKLEKNFVPTGATAAVLLVDADVTRIITVTVEEGEITEELAKKITLSGEFASTDKKGDTLEKLGIKSLEKGKTATITVKWFGGEDDLAKLNAKVGSTDAEATGTDDTAKQGVRKGFNSKKMFDLSGVTVSTKAEMTVELTPAA